MKKVLVLLLCFAFLLTAPAFAAPEGADSPAGEAVDTIAADTDAESADSEGESEQAEAIEAAEVTEADGESEGDSEDAEAAGDSEGESEGDSEGESEGDSGESEGGNGALSTSPGNPVIDVQNDQVLFLESDKATLSADAVMVPMAADSPAIVSGVAVETTDPEAGGVAWNSETDLLLGGEDDIFPVTTYFTREDLNFNTSIILDLSEDFFIGVDSASGFAIEAAGKGTMTVENVYARTTGVNRYSVHTSTGTTIIKDSYFESLGGRGEYCMMPWFTMQFGTSRNFVMTSSSSAYVYNSYCGTDGFASWSTDMTNGKLFLYNADCVNYNGGYGSFADGCTVNIYGSDFNSAEYGVFGCNGGTLNVGSSADALAVTDEVFLENLAGEELEEDTPTVITGDRNAVIMHIVASLSTGDPERNGIVDTDTESNFNTQNKLYATDSVFSTVDAVGTSRGKYPAPMQMYLNHMRGSVLEFRSSNADVKLTNCDLLSSTGILIQSVVNMDGTAIQILDDVPTESILGICIESAGNDWTGNISHEDYQRPMYLTMTGSTLTGAILAPGIDEWLALWEDYKDVHYTLDPETNVYVNDADPSDTGETYTAQDPNNVYLWATALTEYNAVRGVYLTMDASSVWNVTEESSLRGLTAEAGAVISGTVTVDGEAIDISAGGSWTGDIIVTP